MNSPTPPTLPPTYDNATEQAIDEIDAGFLRQLNALLLHAINMRELAASDEELLCWERIHSRISSSIRLAQERALNRAVERLTINPAEISEAGAP